MLKLHADRKEKRQKRQAAGNNYRHAHYHPTTPNLAKRSARVHHNIEASCTCSKCGKVTISRRIDTLEHLRAIVLKSGWKDGKWPEEIRGKPQPVSQTGLCCPACLEEINKEKK